jgi:hypothetical protein
MAEEYRYGQMVHAMKDIGAIIEQMVEGDLYMRMVTSMKENGLMIKLMDLENINI